jgi:hypothetical protein
MTEPIAPLRRDLEYYPVQTQGRQLVLIRDPLGLVPEGKAVEPPLYQLMVLLDGTTTLRDLQMVLMRQQGGILVSLDEVENVVAHLDDSFLLHSEKFRKARNRVVEEFASRKVRASFHGGRSYPADPVELGKRLDAILALQPESERLGGRILALMAPHIDLSAGSRIYAKAYQDLKGSAPGTVILLGIGHQMTRGIFSVSDKDFETPFGLVECDRASAERLREAGKDIIAKNDFVHRAEHSIEFQILFLQHILPKNSFTIVPVLCGNLQAHLPEYSRRAYRERTGGFLEALKEVLTDPRKESLLVAGVDFSHIGPKFGHEMPAEVLEGQSERHDRALLEALSALDADSFWEESRKVQDRYNVCGFSALACLLEVLPPCMGHFLGYEIWHEEATRSAVGFAAMGFTAQGFLGRSTAHKL